jgi:hypothetical protein
MAELSPEDQLALHEFSVRYRAALAKQHPLSDLNLETIQDAIRGDYEREQEANRSPSIEPPDRQTEKEREPEEPDQEH